MEKGHLKHIIACFVLLDKEIDIIILCAKTFWKIIMLNPKIKVKTAANKTEFLKKKDACDGIHFRYSNSSKMHCHRLRAGFLTTSEKDSNRYLLETFQ